MWKIQGVMIVRRSSAVVGLLGRGCLAAMAGYLGVLTAAAWRRRRRSPVPVLREPARRFAVLIPAHDEEHLIGTTIDSLIAQSYPPELIEIHVVADNCADRTAAIAAARGAEVHERRDPANPGKGPALEWLMARLDDADRTFDAYAFVDADTTADPGFLAEIDRAMSSGAVAVQAHYAVRDATAGPAVAFRAASFAARNHLRPLGRVEIGGTAGLLGNGMAFDRATIRSRRWTDHLTEDAELQLELLRDGVLVAFAPDARVAAEMPDTLDAARSQHDRWEQGRIDLARRHLPGLLRAVVTGRSGGRIAAADGAADLLVPPFSVVVAGSSLWAGTATVRVLVAPTRRHRRDAAAAWAVVAVLVWYVVSALRMVEAPPAVYRALLGAPRMVLWKVLQWGRVLVSPRDDGWVRTARNERATDVSDRSGPAVDA